MSCLCCPECGSSDLRQGGWIGGCGGDEIDIASMDGAFMTCNRCGSCKFDKELESVPPDGSAFLGREDDCRTLEPVGVL